MKNNISVLILLMFFVSVVSQEKSIELRFLDEYSYPVQTKFQNTIIGGLSGIDKQGNDYYLVSDDAKNPRFYIAEIHIENNKIQAINFKKTIELNTLLLKQNHYDLESIIVTKNGVVLTSEGKIYRKKDPKIFIVNDKGEQISEFKLPKRFLATSPQKPRNNGLFEGLSKSFNEKGFWSGLEFPLTSDGEKPTYPTSNSPVRFTYFDATTLEPEKEYVYPLSPIQRPKKGRVNLNGLTDILEYEPNRFFVIERTYQSGYKNEENKVQIYEAVIEKNTTNSLKEDSLKENAFQPMKKRLLFDFNSIKEKLTDQSIDNIEGITFGPKLPNGNRSLILVSDDNFQKYGKQLNQFMLLEIVEKIPN